MLTYAILTLIIIFIVFSELCYMTWGSNLNEPYVTQMLPKDQIGVILIKFLFSLNLVCSYPIMVYPANQSIEFWFCGCIRNKKLKYWIANFSRLIVCFLAIITGIFLASKIDRFLGLIGSFACAPLALTFPCLLHYKQLAKTAGEKIFDGTLILISISIFLFCTIQSILDWNIEATEVVTE